MIQNYKSCVEATVLSIGLVKEVVQAIKKAGGQSILVGGAVRDILLGLAVKDIDIEVHGLSIEQLERLLEQFGPVNLVGKSFGVLRPYIKFSDRQQLDIDFTVPRADEPGRKPKVTFDPHMKIKDAFARRDLTINAMGIDLITYELLDPFGGMQDLQNDLLRAPDARLFVEDPLRFYRVMQFIGRFEMVPDAELDRLCAAMDVSAVSRERIEKEFNKLFLKSNRPSLGIRWLKKIGRLDLFPELVAVVDVPQNPDWHPEGDVFEHTMQALDAAAVLDYATEQEKLMVMYGALCHDLGKAKTTEKIDGRWKSFGHEDAGVVPTKKLLKRITNNKELIAAVVKLVKYHMIPVQLIKPEVKLSAYKRLANKLAPVTIEMLAKLCLADKQGRNAKGSLPLTGANEEITEFLARAQEAEVARQAEAPLLLGRDLLDVIAPGPQMGWLLKEAYRIQIDEGIKDKQELRQRVLQFLP